MLTFNFSIHTHALSYNFKKIKANHVRNSSDSTITQNNVLITITLVERPLAWISWPIYLILSTRGAYRNGLFTLNFDVILRYIGLVYISDAIYIILILELDVQLFSSISAYFVKFKTLIKFEYHIVCV